MTDELPSSQINEINENELIAQRKLKLAEWRKTGEAFNNEFRPNALAADLLANYSECHNETLQAKQIRVKLAGRIMLRRIMGKASFAHIQDRSERIQLYLRQQDIGETDYEDFKKWDIGDIIGIEGFLFKTKTDELSLHVKKIKLLTKAIRPLPDKFHGLADQELCYRQRYIDLMMNEQTRRNFIIRSQLVDGIRQFLKNHDFLEVETPMMQTIPGGAAAKPFVTHHNALDMQLFLRIAPELYLKRLVVGGFERVFEINRNFRNEGLSTRHNPEFTMLEFYQAYADYHELMDFTEDMFQALAQQILGKESFYYQGEEIDFAKPFARLTVVEAILHFNPQLKLADITDIEKIRPIAQQLKIVTKETNGLGKLQIEIFDKTVEAKLRQPTFITQYPAEVSPLARRNNQNPFVTDRFELFIAGREIANGFSELNDPEDQAARFRQQVLEKQAGDEEAMHYDADYITALEYGMPPTAGEGIGIDRLTMLFTDSSSIRDVILFPHMRRQE